jgi:hypothetical protein
MPPNTIYAGRPGPFGNRFKLLSPDLPASRENIMRLYAEALERNDTDWAKWVNDNIERLREHDLACWCRLDQPCHAGALLRLANE